MQNIKYIGKKARKVDTFAGTGIVWNGAGDVQPVPDAMVARFLAHTDSFVLATGGKPAPADPVPQAEELVVEEAAKEAPPLMNLETMDANALRDYAQRYFGEQFHHKMGADKMRQRIIGLMNRG